MYNHTSSSVLATTPAPGVTLIELTVTLAIVTIMLTLGAPSFNAMMAKSRLDADSTGLLANLVFAREQARNSASVVTVCMSTDGATCGVAGWNQGYLVFRDGGTVGTVDVGDAALRHAQAVQAGVTIGATYNGGVFTGKYLSFEGEGNLVGTNALRFNLCSKGQLQRRLALRLNGNVSASKGPVVCT